MDKNKKVEKVENKGLKLPPLNPKLTSTQNEVLHLLSDEFLTIKQIAKRRHSSIQAIYKIINKIKKKGVLDIGLNRVEKVEPTHSESDVRLHGQEFNIRILFQDNKYQKLLEKSNTMFLDGNTIRLYKNSIEIYSGQSFYGQTANISESRSLSYWWAFIAKLEHNLKVSLIKPKSRNIKIVNQHYARGNSEIAEDSIKNKERVWVYAEEDGKLCYITDNSFGFKEDETIHPITGKLDRKAVDRQVNDWRLNNPPTNSELNRNIEQLTNITINQQSQILQYTKQIKSHLALINAYRKENKAWRKNESIKIEKEVNNQTKLNEYG